MKAKKVLTSKILEKYKLTMYFIFTSIGPNVGLIGR